jgi:hypothetical protein
VQGFRISSSLFPTTSSPAPSNPPSASEYIWRPPGVTDSLPVASRSWAEQEGPPAAV